MSLPAHTLCVRWVASKVTVGLTVSLRVSLLTAHCGSLWSLVAVMTIS